MLCFSLCCLPAPVQRALILIQHGRTGKHNLPYLDQDGYLLNHIARAEAEAMDSDLSEEIRARDEGVAHPRAEQQAKTAVPDGRFGLRTLGDSLADT